MVFYNYTFSFIPTGDNKQSSPFPVEENRQSKERSAKPPPMAGRKWTSLSALTGRRIP
jgi:hypothetical protein